MLFKDMAVKMIVSKMMVMGNVMVPVMMGIGKVMVLSVSGS